MTRILVIEDEPQMRRNMLTVLKHEGFEGWGAKDGHEGVALAKRELPDLILCDVMMPGLDGYGVLAALRAERATETIPFIFLTARGEREDVRSGMNTGADDYLTKPVTIDDLTGAIRARLDRRDQQQRDLRAAFTSPEPLQKLGLPRAKPRSFSGPRREKRTARSLSSSTQVPAPCASTSSISSKRPAAKIAEPWRSWPLRRWPIRRRR